MLVFSSFAFKSEAQVSLTFSSGYLGTQASATQQTSNIKNLSTLGIARVSFSQSYPGTFGGTQGNDLSGIIRLYMNSGQVISLNGALNWRETTGNNLDVYGLIFDPGQNATITYGSNQTYNIIGGSTNNTSTSLGLKAYASSVTFTDGAARNGNAATSSIIGDMNAELASSPQPSSISLTNTNVIESQNLVFTVTLSSATTSGKPQVYTFNTSGAATKGTDYNSTYTFSNGVINNGDGTITVPGSVSSFTITISTIDDIIVESIENVLVSVGSKTGLGSIIDNDAPNAPNCDVNNPYDKIISGYHQSIALKTDASFAVWGEDLDNTGAGEVLTPRDINVTNYPNLVGTPLKAAIGGLGGGGKEQAVLLTTDGLYVWGSVGYVINYDLKSTASFGKIATNNFTANNVNTSTGLPLGVNPYDVKMLTASYATLVLLTNAGDVWTLSQNVGTNATGDAGVYPKTWFKAKIDATTFLTGITAIRVQASSGSLNAIIALKSDGTVYTWGRSTYLGDGSAPTQRVYATKMTLPAEFSITNIPKMIAVTGGVKNEGSSPVTKNSYYILSNSGALYSLGYNSKRQLGDFTTTERTTWVNAKINSTTNFSNVSFITAQEHDASFPGIAIVTKAGDLYTWGENEGLALGRTTDGTTYDPDMPNGFVSGTDIALSAELGGHTLVYLKQGTTQFCYVGHKTAGSMGDGVSASSFINTFNCTGTPSMNICGSVPLAGSISTSTITASPTSIAANGTTTSIITVQLKQANGTNLTSTGGTVNITTNKGSISSVTDNNDGTYTAILTSSTFVETATLNYTLNGSAGSNSATVNFTAVTNPVLTATGTLKTFTTCSGCTVAPQSFTVSGVDLSTNNLVVTAPSGVQVSTNANSGFATSINIAPTSGTVTTTTVYAKLTSNATSAASGIISVTSTGAAAKTLTVTTNTDNALNFDGVNDYVNITSSAFASAYSNTSVTIEAWIKTTSIANVNEIIGWGSSTAINNVVEFRTSNGQLQFILNDGTRFYSYTSASYVNTGKWVHVAIVKSGTTVSLYINGQNVAATSAGNIASAPTVNAANIGLLAYRSVSNAYGPIAGSYFNGSIDRLRVWNTAKSSADIAANMFVEMAGTETGLIASYDFNQGIANDNGNVNNVANLIDNSANANNGTFSGFALTGTSSNFVAGFIPEITAAGNVTSLASGSTLQLSNSLTGGTWSSSSTSIASINSSGLVTGVASGSVTLTYTICDKVVSYSLTVVQPTLTTSGTLKTFTSCSGCSINPQSFSISGSDLGANVTVTAPTGFVISTTATGTYVTSLTYTPTSGTLTTTSVFANLSNSATSATTGNFTVASTGATSKTVTATVNTDNSLNFDGVDDAINIGQPLASGSSYTIEAWVKYDGSTGPLNIVSSSKNVFYISSNKLTAGVNGPSGSGGGSWAHVQNSNNLPANKWIHVAVTFNDPTKTISLYENGVQVATASTSSSSLTLDVNEPFYIGSHSNNASSNYSPVSFFKGNIDEVRIWNTVLDAATIQSNMYKELAGSEAGLKAYYNFNQGTIGGSNTSISTLNGLTSPAYNGTMSGFALTTGTTSNFVAGVIPDITASGNATTVVQGNTLQLSNGLTGGVWSTSASGIATINSSGLVTGVAAGSVTLTYSICSKTVSFNLTVVVPTLTVSSLKTFTSCSGCTIDPQKFTVSGSNLGANVTVTAPTGFVISTTSTGTYVTSLTFTPTSGTLNSTEVFSKLQNTVSSGTSGNFTVASTGAVSKTVTATVNTDNALNFDGINDHIIIDNIGNNSNLSFAGTSSFTIEAWVNRSAETGANAFIVTKQNSGVDGNYNLFIDANGKPGFYRETSTYQAPIKTSSAIPLNEWHHIAGVYNGSTMKIYLDGVESGSIANTYNVTNPISSLKVAIGAVHSNGTPTGYFKGKIDEVRIWNTARTASQIQNNYLSELSGNETNLKAYYNFNHGIVNGNNSSIPLITNLIDRTSNAINGSINNFALSGSTSNFVAGFIPDISGTTIIPKTTTTTFTNNLTGGTWSSSASSIATVDASGVVTGVAAGTSTITYTICDKTVTKVITIVEPTITTSGTLTAFTACENNVSTAQTFTVTASNLSTNLVLTAPTGYELSTIVGGTYTTTLSITPTSGAVASTSIYVRLSNTAVNGVSGNIVATSSGAVTKNVATGNATVNHSVVASVTISSNVTNNTLCSGTSVLFTATPTNGGNNPTYQWKINGTNITGATSSTYSSTTLSNNDVVTVVMVSSISSCISGSPATSNGITVVVNSIPTAPSSITGSTNICMNSNQVYSVTSVPGATSYTWVVTGDLTASASTNNVINITAASTAGSGTIKVLASNVCGSSLYSATLSVTVNNTPAPTASFTSSATNICLTSPTVSFTNSSIANGGATLTSYNWDFGDGSSQVTTANASRTYSASGTYDVVMSVTSSNQCTSAVSNRIIVDPISVAGTASAANATICENTSTILTLSGNTGTIQWQRSTNGSTWNNITGATYSTYTTANLTATAYYRAVVTSGACSSATSGVITVTVSPVPTVTLANVANVYTNATSFDLSYSNAVGSPNEYSITTGTPNAMPNFTAINGYGLISSPITVSIPASAVGTYNFNLVVQNNNYGCNSANIPFSVTVVVLPPASLSYTTPNVYTTGTTITALNPTSTGGPITQYTIGPSLPAGLTINPTTGVISGTPSVTSSQTTYTVTGTNASGTITATVVITVNASAGAPVVQTQTDYCEQAQVSEYKYAKVVFSNTKTLSAANSIQVAEWKWFNGNSEISRTNVTVTNPNGSNPGGETPSNIYDGSNSTKWLDFNIKSGNNTSTLLFTFPSTGARITGYSWVTANDSEERDPKSWIVYMSNDNVNWTQVDAVSNYVAPSARNTATTAWSYTSGSSPVTLTATAATGYTLRWYTTATGGTATTTAPILNTNTPGTVTYYVSQINQSNYETPRSVLTVNVNALPAAPVVSGVNYTVGATANSLTATALTGHSLQWYTVSSGGTATSTAFIPTTNATGAQNYYVSQVNNTTGCEGARANIVVTVDVAAPASLSYTTPNVYTTGTTITALNPTSTGGPITQYTIGPSLPAGLTINPTTGVISGTPSVTSTQTTYTVTGTNASGTITATVVITVNSNVVPQPQGSLNAVDYGLLASDTVKLKLTTSSGVAPFTLILINSLNSVKDTITNLTPVNNVVVFTQKRMDTTKLFTIYKLIDANNNTRTSGFTKDTTKVNLLKPKILLTLKADPAVKQADNSFKTRLLLKVKNSGDIDLRNVQVNANLSTVFPSGINYKLDSVRVLSGNFALNPSYTGSGTATSASSSDWLVTATANGSRKSFATLDENYLFNNGVSLTQGQEGSVAYYVSIGATTQNVTLKLQFESAGDGVVVKNDGSSSAQGTTSKSDDGTNINQHPDLTNQGLPLPTYVPLIPNEKIGASLNVSSATPVTGGYKYHFTAKIKNYGNVNLDSLRIQYNFNELYPSPDQASLVGTPTITRGTIVYNTNLYDGYNDVNLFKYGGDLQVGDSATYEYDLKVTTARTAYTWPNYFVAYGRSINSGLFVNDTSMAGTNPDPNNDNDPIEKFYTNVTINFTPPLPPTVENKTYLYGSTKPANIGGLVKSTPTGTIPVWCDLKTAACKITPPVTPTEIGKYIFALRSYDTTKLLYSEVLVYDTVIIKPPVPIVVNKKYIIGNTSNPVNVSNQVTGMTGSTLNYFKNAGLQSTVPVLGTIPGVTRYTTGQTVNGIESDTVGFTVTMLDPILMLHLRKIADEPKLQTNSTFNITYTFIVTNRTDEAMTNVLIADNLQNTFPSPTLFDIVSVSSTGGLVYNSAFNGKTDIQLLKATSNLAAAAIDTIRLTVNLQPKGYNGTVNNVAVITATTPYGNLNINSSSTGFANETAKLPTPAVIPDLSIDIPEAFSPNRDGVNDRFVILKPFGTTLELEVYNRWGNVVYYNANYNNEWDGRGTNNFIGQDLMDGGYYYTLKAKSANGNSQIFKGFVLIQR